MHRRHQEVDQKVSGGFSTSKTLKNLKISLKTLDSWLSGNLCHLSRKPPWESVKGKTNLIYCRNLKTILLMLTTMNHGIYYIITVMGTGIRAPGFRKPGN